MAREPRGDLRVAHHARHPAIGAAKHGEVVVRAMHPDLGPVESVDQRPHVLDGDGIDQREPAADSELDEAELFLVVMQTVGLGVDEAGVDLAGIDLGFDRADEFPERVLGVDPGMSLLSHGAGRRLFEAGEQDFRVAAGALDVADEHFQALDGGNGGELLANHGHALEFIGMVEHVVAAGAGLLQMDRRDRRGARRSRGRD